MKSILPILEMMLAVVLLFLMPVVLMAESGSGVFASAGVSDSVGDEDTKSGGE